MRELPRTAVPSPVTAVSLGLGEVLAGSDGGSPAPPPASRRRDGQRLARMAAARARRVTPPLRSLPRRGGY
ncbi:hypothetical protein AB0H03_04655 [Streptomyces sparsogenes]|uniref:hypothetical protein n=1 Tax=Streptomyces sparsogenes TaxID=67365 RepID=UPI0033CB64B3